MNIRKRPEKDLSVLEAIERYSAATDQEVVGLLRAVVKGSINDHTYMLQRVQFLTRVGNETDPIEPHLDLRQLARRLLVEGVLPAIRMRLTFHPDRAVSYQGSVEEFSPLIDFFSREEHVRSLDEKHQQGLRYFLTEAWGAREHWGLDRGKLINALINVGAFEVLLMERILEAIPTLFDQLKRMLDLPGVEKLSPLEWRGWEDPSPVMGVLGDRGVLHSDCRRISQVCLVALKPPPSTRLPESPRQRPLASALLYLVTLFRFQNEL